MHNFYRTVYSRKHKNIFSFEKIPRKYVNNAPRIKKFIKIFPTGPISYDRGYIK